MSMGGYELPLTITFSIASPRTRWTHRPKTLSTRGDNGAETTCDKVSPHVCPRQGRRRPTRGALDHHVQHRTREDTVDAWPQNALDAWRRRGRQPVTRPCAWALRAVLRPHVCPRQGHPRPTRGALDHHVQHRTHEDTVVAWPKALSTRGDGGAKICCER